MDERIWMKEKMKDYMKAKEMFEEISIIGRVAYAGYCLEVFLKEKGYHLEDFRLLLESLWAFSEMEAVDDYAYKLIECTPETLFDEREDFNTFDYFNAEELIYMKEVYQNCNDVDVIQYVMEQINEILAFNLYTTVQPPETYSFNIMEKELYPFLAERLERMPKIEPFQIYSIKEENCWGVFYSRKELFIDGT